MNPSREISRTRKLKKIFHQKYPCMLSGERILEAKR